jgi:hypothetical protein
LAIITVHKTPTCLLIFNAFVPPTQLFELHGYSAPIKQQLILGSCSTFRKGLVN